MILKCRRTTVAILGMLCCVAITNLTGADTSAAVAAIALGVAGANAAQAAAVMGFGRSSSNTNQSPAAEAGK